MDKNNKRLRQKRERASARERPIRRVKRTVPPSMRGTPHRRQNTPITAVSSTIQTNGKYNTANSMECRKVWANKHNNEHTKAKNSNDKR